MMAAFFIAVVVALAPVPAALSPEAGEHNARAMQLYDARQLGPAFAEFKVAYDTMPDPRRDRAGRELLLGSMRATLLEWHEASGDPGPLCRLQAVLQAHMDALTTAYPDTPDMLEIRGVRARLEQVTRQLAGIGADVCAPTALPSSPSPAPASAPAPAPVLVSAPVSVRPERPRGPVPAGPAVPPRQLRVAGGVTLGLGGALLGVMTYGVAVEAQRKARANSIAAGAGARPLTADEYTRLIELRADAMSARYVAISAGVAAGVATGLGTMLLVLARRSTRARRLAIAPWWLPGGAGLSLGAQFGAADRP